MSAQMEFTGERFVPQIHGNIELEHMHRYLMACDLAAGKDVLDIACGEGYGSARLAQSARQVYGVDISKEAVAHAGANYPADNLRFLVGSCEAIPLPDKSVDLVVSFETIEHHDKHEEMMLEIKRVLRPNGVVIISSPDKQVYSIEPNYRNPYHVKELFADEFKKLISNYFKNAKHFGQKIAYGSAIVEEDGSSPQKSYWDENNQIHNQQGLYKPVYILSIGSDSVLPAVYSGIYGRPESESGYASSLISTIGERDLMIEELRHVVRDRTRLVKEREQKVRELDRWLVKRDEEIDALIAIVESAKAWQKRSWFKRSFHRWRATPGKVKKVGVLKKIERKLRKKRNQVLKLLRKDSSLQSAKDPLDPKVTNSEVQVTSYPYKLDYPNNNDTVSTIKNYPPGTAVNVGEAWAPIEFNSLDKSRETIIVVSHSACRTGAPILVLNIAKHFGKKYNVVALLLESGVLELSFEDVCNYVINLSPNSDDPKLGWLRLDSLLNYTNIKFAIVNSIESRALLPFLKSHSIPTLCLVHEFASSTGPRNAICDVVGLADKVVFSAELVYENNAVECEVLKDWNRKLIIPQGKCVVPLANDDGPSQFSDDEIRRLLRPETFTDETIVILGAGTVHFRKGVDLFIMCAARVLELNPVGQFRFVWIGDGYNPENDVGFSSYLHDQIQRAGLERHVCLIGAVSNIELVYEHSNILLLSSRLDPLPNVAIDSMLKMIPVVCFDKTTGIADILSENGLGEFCVAPYLDIEQAARQLVLLINNNALRKDIGIKTKGIAEKIFDMERYVDILEYHVLTCQSRENAGDGGAEIIAESQIMDLRFYTPPSHDTLTYYHAAQSFVASWKEKASIRKPFPGFHPGIYEDLRMCNTNRSNPLFEFLQEGRPTGPWLSDLIQPNPYQGSGGQQSLRAALHIHAYYLDLVPNILDRLTTQSIRLDLLISVPSTNAAKEIAILSDTYKNGSVFIESVPNRGRDIGPLLTCFSQSILESYDIIGHVHTKKSIDIDNAEVAAVWFDFLLENLVGGKHPMSSIILNKFAEQDSLGLVFPDDPNMIGWSANRKEAERLALQLKIGNIPDRHFNFPVGTMFWARTDALQPLLGCGFVWNDYPEEPLPYDGTMLHAIERLIPAVVESRGYESTLTHIPGVTR